MKVIINVILLPLFLVGTLNAQNKTAALDSSRLDNEIVSDFLFQKKMNVNVEFGSYFATSKGLGSGFGTYIAPQISYQISPRFRLSSGVKVFQSQGFGGIEHSNYYYPAPLLGHTFGSLLFVRGDYRLTEKLSVSGTAYKQVDLFRLNQSNPTNINYDYQGIIMGVDYQLGENFFIHGEVEFSNGYNSYRYQRPFHRNQLGDPFHNSTFQR